MANKKDDEKELVLPSSSPPDNEFISDAFNEDNINEEDLRAEMQQFGLTEEKKGNGKNRRYGGLCIAVNRTFK